jgi:hypothetical protein
MGILLSWVNLADAAGLTASSTAGTLSVSNLKAPQIVEVWRSGAWGATTLDLRADLQSAQSFRFVAIAAPRDGVLPNTLSTVRLTAGSTLDATNALDTGAVALGSVMAAHGLWCWVGSAAVSARYVRLQFTGTAADSYLQLGRLWIGPALVTARQAAYGFSFGAADPGANARAGVSGVRTVLRGTPYRRLAFSVPTLTTAEANDVIAAAETVGTTGQVFGARLHTDAAATGAFGHFSEPPAAVRVSHLLWRADFAIEEDL